MGKKSDLVWIGFPGKINDTNMQGGRVIYFAGGLSRDARQHARLRTTVISAHSYDDIDFALEVFEEAGKKTGLILSSKFRPNFNKEESKHGPKQKSLCFEQ